MREAIKTLRERLDLTQEGLAPMLGRGSSTVQSYERGTPIPRAIRDRLIEICKDNGWQDLAAIFADAPKGGKVKSLDDLTEAQRELVMRFVSLVARLWGHKEFRPHINVVFSAWERMPKK